MDNERLTIDNKRGDTAMKWFHHECTASQDNRMQRLIENFGAEGYGIYWRILETIGQQSEYFHLKVDGISEEYDQHFAGVSEESSGQIFGSATTVGRIPRLSLTLLAKNLQISRKKLVRIITLCVGIGLFDPQKWAEYTVLFSPGLARRSEDYTRRYRKDTRAMSRSRTQHVTQESGTAQPNSHTEQERETEGEVEDRERKDLLLENVAVEQKLSPSNDDEKMHDDITMENNHDEKNFIRSSSEIVDIIRSWNSSGRRKCDWVPTQSELRKLLYGGSPRRKEWLCYETMNTLGGEVTFARVVGRAVRMMLEASVHRRILNPFGWVWTCLYGNRVGSQPWVQLTTAREEQPAFS